MDLEPFLSLSWLYWGQTEVTSRSGQPFKDPCWYGFMLLMPLDLMGCSLLGSWKSLLGCIGTTPSAHEKQGDLGPRIFSKPAVLRLPGLVLHTCLLSRLTNVWHLLNQSGWQTFSSGGAESHECVGTPLTVGVALAEVGSDDFAWCSASLPAAVFQLPEGTSMGLRCLRWIRSVSDGQICRDCPTKPMGPCF